MLVDRLFTCTYRYTNGPAVEARRRWATAARRWQRSGKKGKEARIGSRKLATLVWWLVGR